MGSEHKKTAGTRVPTVFGIGSGDRTRTCDKSINSRLLYQLSYAGSVLEARTGIEPVYTALQAAA